MSPPKRGGPNLFSGDLLINGTGGKPNQGKDTVERRIIELDIDEAHAQNPDYLRDWALAARFYSRMRARWGLTEAQLRHAQVWLNYSDELEARANLIDAGLL